MADIRISALPNEPTPNGTDVLPIDGATTRKTTITAAVLAGRPTASQAEAEAGTDPTKAMTPLTTAQAIAFQAAAGFVPQSRTLTAGVGLDGGGDLSANRTFDVNFTEVQAFSTKLTNFDGTSLTAGALIFAAGANTFTVLAAGSPNQFLQNIAGNPTWTNAAAGGDVTGPASSITGSIPTFNGTTGKIMQAGNPTLADFLAASRGVLPTIANDTTDATNDIVFSAGAAFSTDATNWPMIGASRIKQLDAAWAVGTNAGGRMSAAAIANTTYHCYQIRRPDTGVVDYGFDVSATAPTLPANYTQYRRIGSILRESNVIVPFRQDGDKFKRVTGVQFYSSTAGKASALTVMLVPLGIVCEPIVNSALAVSVSGNVIVNLGDAAAGVAGGSVQQVVAGVGGIAGDLTPVVGGFSTNTNGELYHSVTIFGGTISSCIGQSLGWYDSRGR